jgi:hypothetical protein
MEFKAKGNSTAYGIEYPLQSMQQWVKILVHWLQK